MIFFRAEEWGDAIKVLRSMFSLDNIMLSPHNAALTLECRKRMSVESCENIVYYLSNKSKLNIANIVNRKKINLEVQK